MGIGTISTKKKCITSQLYSSADHVSMTELQHCWMKNASFFTHCFCDPILGELLGPYPDPSPGGRIAENLQESAENLNLSLFVKFFLFF